jgi:hypothetical protein
VVWSVVVWSGCVSVQRVMKRMSAIRIKNNKIISMNQFIPATISQQALNFTAFMSEDDLRIGK